MFNIIMPRRPDPEKTRKILGILKKYPHGIWFRQLVRETGLPASTVHFYLKKLSGIVESIGYVDEDGRFVGIRIVRLKKNFQE